MLCKTNYHTHSTWCDGKASLEEMVQAAIQADLKILGFSSHSMYPFGTNWHLQPRCTTDYCTAVQTLQKKYKDQIEILVGFEADYLPPVSFPEKERYAEFKPDFLIGSVHFITDESLHHDCFTVDGSCKELEAGIQNCFNGDTKKAVQVYFATQRDMISRGGFDIIGHLDVIRKRNDSMHLFNENDSWYKKELDATAKTVAKSGLIAEINTGGMARAGLKTPYPSPDFLTLLNQYNVPIMINSDAHQTNGIAYKFEFAAQYARNAGYKEVQYLTKGIWKHTPL
jgi:histidinol-phosphatase (PHP family)